MFSLKWPEAVIGIPDSVPVYFVADLHLSTENPRCVRGFCDFLGAIKEGTVVVLGDLFHLYWGPEVLADPLFRGLCRAFLDFRKRGKAYFLWGNRDFQVGRELTLTTGVKLGNEAVVFNIGEKLVYACHGDQLCLDDYVYQRMKSFVRSPAVLGLWRDLPASLRKRLVFGVRSVTARKVEKKTTRKFASSERALKRIFSQGVDAIVSGHRHVTNRKVKYVKGRKCTHFEVPPWCEQGVFLVGSQGKFCFERFEGK